MKLILLLYAAISLLTFASYGFDKRAARLGRRRVPEARLHWLELLGGWPGGLAGQVAFRHKHRKGRYMAVFWLIVFLHLVLWASFGAWRAGWFG